MTVLLDSIILSMRHLDHMASFLVVGTDLIRTPIFSPLESVPLKGELLTGNGSSISGWRACYPPTCSFGTPHQLDILDGLHRQACMLWYQPGVIPTRRLL